MRCAAERPARQQPLETDRSGEHSLHKSPEKSIGAEVSLSDFAECGASGQAAPSLRSLRASGGAPEPSVPGPRSPRGGRRKEVFGAKSVRVITACPAFRGPTSCSGDRPRRRGSSPRPSGAAADKKDVTDS
ncbi:hypothetical protein AAFF_G00054040 [Aldrovandia affinis]|uniref:Uncharacterized protein n=1 Tax=Aldrovandia affinis TaxID=143900 RepID=A0AAD7S161_9TELE|nr:hypothetical protein AAFF_G00054040 [Aldrovandia affinis]